MWVRRLLIGVGAVLVALAVVLGGAGPAGAHATLQATSPAAEQLLDAVPGAVELRFDEPISASTGAVQVLAPDGGRVDRAVGTADGGRTVRVPLDGGARGTYTVAYRVVSDDGHTITGSFVFHVGERTGAAEVDQDVPVLTSGAGGLGRWLGYAGAVVAVGAALLLAVAQRGAGAGAAQGRLWALTAGGAALAGLGADVAVVAQTATTTGRSLAGALSLVPEVAGDSRPVAVALGRASLLLLAALVALLGRRRPALVVAGGALAAASALVAPAAGHPWTADPRALAVPADALHLLAASVWLGLLVALAATASRLPDPVAAVRQVSAAALVAAVVVLLSGTASAALLLGSLDALFQTSSGQLVLAKVAGFGALVFLGWLNRVRLVPLLARAVGVDDDGAGEAAPRRALTTLLQVVRVEVVVGALVLAVTAGLVNQPPGRDQLEQPFSGTQVVEGGELLLEVEPARAGQNELHVYLRDPAGQPVAFDAVEVTASRPDVPARRLEVEQVTPDHAVAYGASLPTPGSWTVAVTTVGRGTSRTFRFEVPVR